MTLHAHDLPGCAPEPLAHYLKALGILRLVADQRDEGARGLWRNERFVLVTKLDRAALLEFFSKDYVPTPILAPWNGGSGFYPKDKRDALLAIRDCSTVRFEPYRKAIRNAEALVAGRPKSPKDDEKSSLLAAYARTQDDPAYAWLSATVALDREGAGRYPALLGSGGNDGRLDFTNNFMQRLVELVDVGTGGVRRGAVPLLELALFGGARVGLVDHAIGQFLPGAAGGANGTAGFEAGARMNPWDFVLMLEGAVVLRVAALRRLDGSEIAQAAAPFALRNTTEGYGTATATDASARGEQWFPVWQKPASLAEVAHLFAEAKLAAGRGPAESALDAARAAARLGAARGVSSFRRFSFIERNGQANLAVPLGAVAVTGAPRVRLLDELDEWLDRFRRAGRADHAPASFQRNLRAIEGAAFACTRPDATAAAWQRLVCALGEAEEGMVRRPKATAASHLLPLPRLSPSWLDTIDDGATETRLAVAISSGRAPRRPGAKDLGPIRANCAPLAPSLTAFRATSESLARDPDVVWTGRDLILDLGACVLRRAIRAKESGYRAFPLDGARPAMLDDVAAFLEGLVDEALVAQLARGLMSVDFTEHSGRGTAARFGPLPGVLACYAVFRTVFSPWETEGARAAPDPTALRLLLGGRVNDALRVATSRMIAMGLRPKIRVAAGDAMTAQRLAAALAIPITKQDHRALRWLVSRPFDLAQETHA
jgi:CRISPR-associated protein Csx17